MLSTAVRTKYTANGARFGWEWEIIRSVAAWMGIVIAIFCHGNVTTFRYSREISAGILPRDHSREV